MIERSIGLINKEGEMSIFWIRTEKENLLHILSQIGDGRAQEADTDEAAAHYYIHEVAA